MEIAHRFIGGTIARIFSPVGTADDIDVSSRSCRNKEFTKIWECARLRQRYLRTAKGTNSLRLS